MKKKVKKDDNMAREYSMVGRTHTICMNGFEAVPVEVEVNILPGYMGMQIIGLGDSAVKESKDRIRSAIVQSGFDYPVGYIIVNLAPNEVPKEGAMAELAIAIAILIASGQADTEVFFDKVILGSLSLDGRIQAPDRILSAAITVRAQKFYNILITPYSVVSRLQCIPGVTFYGVSKLSEIILAIEGGQNYGYKPVSLLNDEEPVIDISHIRGQEGAKLGLAYAATGRHHLMMIGAPGVGKSMLARAFEFILPDLTLDESLEITNIYSSAKLITDKLITRPPFRAPHHTSSDVALVGGGSMPIPGEITMAHHGTLFLDELFEFKNSTLQSLREPLEEKKILVSRARRSVLFPADFIMLATTNPCRCGYILSLVKKCSCRPQEALNLFKKVVGPFLDRISIEVELNEQSSSVIQKNPVASKGSTWYKSKITEARKRMLYRNKGVFNSRLQADFIYEIYDTFPGWREKVLRYSSFYNLSHRGLINTLKLGLSIMDFQESSIMKESFIDEAFSFRVAARLQNLLLEMAA